MPEFIVPPPFGAVGDYSDDNNYALSSNIVFSWSGSVSDTQGFNLWLKQDRVGYTCTELNLANTLCWLILSDVQQTEFNWFVNIPDFNGAKYDQNQPYYWINMYDSDNTFGGEFGSHYFNVLPSSLMPASATVTGYPPGATSSSASASGGASSASSTAASIVTASPVNPSATTSGIFTSIVSSASSGASNVASSTASAGPGTSQARSATTTGTSTLNTSTRSSGNTASSTSGSNSATSSSAASSSTSAVASSSGLDSTTKIGLGVGLGVGIPIILLLAAIAFLLLRNNKRKHRGQATPVMSEQGGSYAPPGYHEAPDVAQKPWQDQQRVHEMSGQNFRITSPTELDAHPYR